MVDSDYLFQNFERDGEETVRNNLTLGRYSEQKSRLAKEWLRRKDEARADAKASADRAPEWSSANAGWAAVAISSISLVVSTFALLKP